MRNLALQIEHKYKNRVVGVHIIDSHRSTTTIGSALTADIRMLGDEVAGLHAAIQRDGEIWMLSDLGSEAGTWINKKPIVETKIDGATVIHIGSHQLKATPHVLDRELFAQPIAEEMGAHVYHQVVVLKHSLLQQSLLLERGEVYKPQVPGFGPLSPPTDFTWSVHEAGVYTIKQRLAKSDVTKESLSEALGGDWKGPAPILGALLMVAVIFATLFLLPMRPDDQMKTLTPDLQNQYTRLILDGQRVRSKKAIAEKLRKTIHEQSNQGGAKSTPGGSGEKVAAAPSKAPPGARVVLNLKNAGLGALIGRVAARAAKNAQLVQSAGVTADSPHAGRGLGLGGGTSLDKLGGGAGGPMDKAQKVGGLATTGKAGGSSSYKGTGALAAGNVGTADVGVIEEETEVDGGLDKEAIARVIRQQLGQIRYCYERQLSANPDLYGKILVKFTIGNTGAVVAQAVGNTSLNNAMVEGCILRRIAGWQFPTPKGGTNVLVTYPFLFKSTR